MATKPKKPAAKAKATRPAAKRRQAEKHHDRAKLVPLICDRLSKGDPNDTLAAICRDLEVPYRTVHDWREHDPAIRAAFDEARDLGHDAIAHRTRATARGLTKSRGGDSTGDVQRDKLIIDTDLKLLAKWDPRRYGEKVQLADSNGDNLPAPQFIIQPVRPKDAGE